MAILNKPDITDIIANLLICKRWLLLLFLSNRMGHELRLSLDLLRGPTPITSGENTFIGEMRKRFAEIHKFVRRRMHLCSDKMKSWYDTYSQPISFVPREQVWLYYPRRMKEKPLKLQSNWEY